MGKRSLFAVLGSILAIVGASVVIAPAASAASCPDVEVVFARGTAEPAPQLGLTGLSFGEAMRAQMPGKSVAVDGVNYAASSDFNNKLRFAETVVQGIKTTQNRITSIAAACPRTKIVLGGYSQGAAVVSYATQPVIQVPDAYRKYASYVPAPLPTGVASHVAAVVLFGPPSDNFISQAGAPPVRTGPLYASKTARYCIQGDTVCNGAPIMQPNALHTLYMVNGMTLDAARFAAQRM